MTTTTLTPPAPDLYHAARTRAARAEHQRQHRAYWQHILASHDEGSDDWRCRSGDFCDTADRIHHEAMAAAERIRLAEEDERRALRRRFSVVPPVEAARIGGRGI